MWCNVDVFLQWWCSHNPMAPCSGRCPEKRVEGPSGSHQSLQPMKWWPDCWVTTSSLEVSMFRRKKGLLKEYRCTEWWAQTAEAERRRKKERKKQILSFKSHFRSIFAWFIILKHLSTLTLEFSGHWDIQTVCRDNKYFQRLQTLLQDEVLKSFFPLEVLFLSASLLLKCHISFLQCLWC